MSLADLSSEVRGPAPASTLLAQECALPARGLPAVLQMLPFGHIELSIWAVSNICKSR